MNGRFLRKCGWISPNKIMQIARKCRMPNRMRSAGTTSHVTNVTTAAIPASFRPRSRLECERLEEMPAIKIKRPANQGSAGMKKLSRALPNSKLNR